MISVLEKLANTGGWVPLVLGFGILPYIYLFFATEVHKEYADFVKTVLTSQDGTKNARRLLLIIDDELYVFELEWWMIVAIALMMAIVFNLSALLDVSLLAENACSHAIAHVEVPNVSECDKGRSVITLYSICVTVLIAFRIAWARVRAAKRLRQLYVLYVKR